MLLFSCLSFLPFYFGIVFLNDFVGFEELSVNSDGGI